MRSSTTKNSQNRINQLQKSIDQLKTEIQNTADIETRYQLQNEKIQNLDSKVIRSENARRTISNRIQDIKGNISCFAVLSPSLHPGSSCLEVTPDETKIMMRNPIGKMIGYSYDRVFGGNFENEEIVERFLREHADFSALESPVLGGWNRTFWPQEDGGDGFFAALLCLTGKTV